MHIKRCSIAYVIRQLQIKTFKRYHYMSIILSKSQNLRTPNADQDVDQWKLSVIAGGNAEWYSYIEKYLESYNLNINLNACACCMLNHIWLFVTPWSVAYQAPLSMEFSRQEYCSGLPFPRYSSQPRDWTCVSYTSCIGRQILYHCWEFLGLQGDQTSQS